MMSTVYILGSGFSTAAGAPLSRQALARIFQNEYASPQLAELELWLDRHLFSKRPDWQQEANIEEVVTRLDLYGHYQALSREELNNLKEKEELLLGSFTQLLQPELLGDKPHLYRQFINKTKPNDTIITFNYDLILEHTLQSMGVAYRYPKLHHCELETPSTISLLKLHGSLNFYFCPVCGRVYDYHNRYTQRPSRLANHGITLYCSECKEEANAGLKHLMIAPTLFKSYTIPMLRDWWFLALQALSQAERVFFIGYSIPQSDLLAAQLFDFASRLAPQPPQVWLVNGPRNDGSQHLKVFQDSTVINTRLSFEEWIYTVISQPRSSHL